MRDLCQKASCGQESAQSNAAGSFNPETSNLIQGNLKYSWLRLFRPITKLLTSKFVIFFSFFFFPYFDRLTD